MVAARTRQLHFHKQVVRSGDESVKAATPNETGTEGVKDKEVKIDGR